MPFLFTCPHCATRTQVDDQYSGKQGQCVSCGSEIQLPLFTVAQRAGSSVATKSTQSKGSKMLGILAATAVCLLILGSLVLGIIRWGGQTMSTLANGRQQTASLRNLERIAAAMNAYAADHGAYPPPMTQDSSGTPLHCWRVLLLPYLDEEELYDRIELDLAWDHPANRMVTDYKIPPVFLHPDGNGNRPGSGTAYHLITGTGTLFPASGPLGPSDVSDDVTQTLLVVEGSPVMAPMSWTEPMDLSFAMMQGNLAGGGGGNEAGGLLEGGVAAATVDGRSHFIRDSTAASDFRALVTPTGGERLADDTLD